jgi:hypothetical protein
MNLQSARNRPYVSPVTGDDAGSGEPPDRAATPVAQSICIDPGAVHEAEQSDWLRLRLSISGFKLIEANPSATAYSVRTSPIHLLRIQEHRSLHDRAVFVPEIVLVANQKTKPVYQVRVAAHMPGSTFTAITSTREFPPCRVPFRGAYTVDDIVSAVMRAQSEFPRLATKVAEMAHRRLDRTAQARFASAAYMLRFSSHSRRGIQPSQLIRPALQEYRDQTLWELHNAVLANLLLGGLTQLRCDGRYTRTRAITCARTVLGISSGLWACADALKQCRLPGD